MTTSTLEVGGLFSALDAHGIERQLKRITGVGRVLVNPISGSTTVMYDPETTSLGAIQAAIRMCGFHCAGEALPTHICDREGFPSPSLAARTGSRMLGKAAFASLGFESRRSPREVK